MTADAEKLKDIKFTSIISDFDDSYLLTLVSEVVKVRSAAFNALYQSLSTIKKLNPLCLKTMLAEEALDRGLIDECEFDFILSS